MLSFIQKITIIICKSFTLNNFGYYIKNKSEGGLNVCILTNSTTSVQNTYTCTSVKHIQQSCAHQSLYM